jgi:triacylglycerol lipase
MIRAKVLGAYALAGAIAACGGGDGGDDARASGHASVAAADGDYPIVLAHGFFGFEDFAGLDFLNYYYGVKDHLAAQGEHQIFTPAVDPFNDSIHRGRQLLARVEEIVRTTGARKVNLVGHSQGGLDARFVAHERPDLVASVITVATPHRGMPFADIALGLTESPVASFVVDALVRALGGPLWDELGKETSLASSIRQFSTPSITAFNATYTDVPGIPYFSLAGRTALSLGGDECDTNAAPTWVTRWATTRDTTEPLFKPIEVFVGGFSRTPNDGLVRVEDARWGTFLGCVPADHLDQIGHLFGGSPGFGNRWSHLDFYTEIVRFIRARGL